MSSEKLPDPDDWPWDFEERRGNAGVWIMEGWDGYDQDALESVFQHYDLRKNESDITGTVAIFGEDTVLPTETQEYVAVGKTHGRRARCVRLRGIENDGCLSER